MNPLNKKALELTNTTTEDFLDFCTLTGKNKTDKHTRKDYFKKILNKEIARDVNGKIILKKVK